MKSVGQSVDRDGGRAAVPPGGVLSIARGIMVLGAMLLIVTPAHSRPLASSFDRGRSQSSSESKQSKEQSKEGTTGSSSKESAEEKSGDQQDPAKSSGKTTPSAPAANAPAQDPNAERKGEWVFAPIPVNSPAIGAGLVWAVGYVFPFSKEDKISPPSMMGIGGLFTNNGSKATALGARLYLKEDKYRVAAGIGNASINADFFGTGQAAGERGIFIPLNVKGSGFMTEFLFQFRKHFYIGPRLQYRNLRVSVDREEGNLPDNDLELPAEIREIIDGIRDNLFRQKTVALGPRLQFDTRDNTMYPKRGLFVDSGIDFFAEAIGSKFTYQYTKIAVNKYVTLKDRNIVAFRGMGCAATGDRIPFYDLCLFGTTNDLRGYAAGRFQDRRMFATQAEYRYTLPQSGFLGRFGLVGFGGVGGVGRKFSDISISDMLPSGGAGIRFRLTKQNPINFRIDYGFGKVGNTLSIGIFEAF